MPDDDLTPERLAELERLEKAATPGPWVFEVSGKLQDGSITSGMCSEDGCTIFSSNNRYYGSASPSVQNVDFIAALRNAAPTLLREVSRLREENAKLAKELQDYKDGASAEAFHGDEARDEVVNLAEECERLREENAKLHSYLSAGPVVRKELAPGMVAIAFKNRERQREEIITLTAARDDAEKRAGEASDIIRDLADDEPCRYDHDDFCQEHYCGKPCKNEVALAFLARGAGEGEKNNER